MDTRYSGTVRRTEPGAGNTVVLHRRDYGRYGRRDIRGKRNAYKYGGGSNGAGRHASRTVRLFVCFGIVLLTLLLKLVFPTASVKMKRELLPVLENSVDYRAAFSSMGRFFAGETGFSEAFSDMVAFLVTGKEAVRAGAVPDAARVPVLGSSVVGAQAIRNPGILPSENSSQSQPLDITVVEKKETGAEDLQTGQALPEPTDEVREFVESQGLFYGYDIPEDVVVERIELPFEYTKPVDGILSSGFGYRVHPVDSVVKFHYGLDFDAPEGTDILAFADGTVLVSGESSVLGYYLIVSHGDGFVTQYFHCKKINVLSGDRVEKGQKIAEVGQTGNATGPCLHFEIIYNGSYLNPEYYLKNEG